MIFSTEFAHPFTHPAYPYAEPYRHAFVAAYGARRKALTLIRHNALVGAHMT